MAKTAISAEFDATANSPEEAVIVDGDPFPYHLHAEPIKVEAIAPGLNIVYLPVIVDGPVIFKDGKSKGGK